MSYLLQLEVCPSEKQLLGGQFHQFADILPWSEEVDEARHVGHGDPLEEVHLDELPHQPQHQPLLPLARVEGVTVDADHHAADGLGRVDGQGQVLVLLQDAKIYYSTM